MHDTAMEAGRIFFETYSQQQTRLRILDVGSQDVNGSLRSVAPKNAEYIGADMVEGRGVDVLLENPYTFPFDADEFDLLVSSSCFEHIDMFWVTFLEMVRVTKAGGYIYINVPSNGAFHRYPRDNWRFYPDSGRALEIWAQRQDSPVLLMECLTLRRWRDVWNDCVLVFRKEPPVREAPTKLMCDHFTNAQNITRIGSDNILNFSEKTEDMELIARFLMHSRFRADSERTSYSSPRRNDQCPCGSGLKYKHCHGKLDPRNREGAHDAESEPL